MSVLRLRDYRIQSADVSSWWVVVYNRYTLSEIRTTHVVLKSGVTHEIESDHVSAIDAVLCPAQKPASKRDEDFEETSVP